VFPDLIRIGNFHIATYGVMCALGMILGLTVVFRLARQQGLDPDKMWNLGVLVIFAGIVGAKILYIINEWGTTFRSVGDIFSLGTMQAGGVFSGGLVLAIIAAVWYLRKNNISFLRATDVFAPGLALGHAFGRVGCFAAGCCYGRETSVPWGVIFTNPKAQEITGTPLGVRIHPTQLYEMVAELINFAILYYLATRKKFEGEVIGLYLFLYGIQRFIIEFYRGDPGRGVLFGGMISGTQLISIGLVITGGILWMRRVPLRTPQLVPSK
jgi:phosphatidylglycerol:prolipoprotein diacylglycerol transferase